jgi:hypothetical protein
MSASNSPVRAIVIVACSAALALLPSAAASGQKVAKPAQKEISKELVQLFTAHFDDQGQAGVGDAAELARRRTARRDRVVEIVTEGGLATLDDWTHAAVVLAYADDPRDVLLAHVLSIRPAIADVGLSRHLCALSLDRYLQAIGKSDPFGTLTVDPKREQLLGFGEPPAAIPGSVRRLFGLDVLPGKDPKRPPAPASELKKLLAGAEGDAAALARAREIVVAGTLKSGADYLGAAQVLRRGTSADDQLLAHVCALAAAFLKQAEGERIAVETLDRFLLAISKPQILGTVLDDQGRPRKPVELAPPVVCAGFGLGPEEKPARNP